MKRSIRPIIQKYQGKQVKSKKCISCKNEEKKKWIETLPGCTTLVYLCCEATKKKYSGNVVLHKYREPVVFGYDKKTGRPLAMDKKGKTFDPADTRYNLENDRYGWGATGKIPKKKTYII